MADDLKKTGLDCRFIALKEPHEVRSWTESFGCTEAELRAAVKAVGKIPPRRCVSICKKVGHRLTQLAETPPNNCLHSYSPTRPSEASQLEGNVGPVFQPW